MSNSAPRKRSESEVRFQAVYDEIRDRICLLQYPPGMALREETLAEEFGVSRTPIRRVLQQLEFEELVVHTPGAGVIVTTIDLKSLREVYKLRLKLAEFVGDMMAARIPDETFNVLESLVERCKAIAYNPTALAQLYNEFHGIMLGMLNNRPFQRIQDQLFHQTSRVWLDILPDLDWDEEVSIVVDEITDVIAALKAGDVHQAAAVRHNHMSMLLQRLNDYLSSADVE